MAMAVGRALERTFGAITASRDVVEFIGAGLNGVADGVLLGMEGKAPALAIIAKNALAPIAYLLAKHPLLGGMAKSAIYFWALIFSIPGEEEKK